MPGVPDAGGARHEGLLLVILYLSIELLLVVLVVPTGPRSSRSFFLTWWAEPSLSVAEEGSISLIVREIELKCPSIAQGIVCEHRGHLPMHICAHAV